MKLEVGMHCVTARRAIKRSHRTPSGDRSARAIDRSPQIERTENNEKQRPSHRLRSFKVTSFGNNRKHMQLPISDQYLLAYILSLTVSKLLVAGL